MFSIPTEQRGMQRHKLGLTKIDVDFIGKEPKVKSSISLP